MDWQLIINLLGAGIMACIGWFVRTVWDAINKMQEDLHQIEVDLPMHYIRKDEFATAMEKIEKALDRIFDRLDGKADR